MLFHLTTEIPALPAKYLIPFREQEKRLNLSTNGLGAKNLPVIQATENKFQSGNGEPAIFHLAMHSLSDSTNSRYSYLMFDTHNSSPEDGKLYNYEISLSRIKSPMVVLSACNSGTGTLYSW